MKLLGIVIVFACGGSRTPTPEVSSERAADIEWLDSLDTRYQGFARPLELADWQRAIGEPPDDTRAAEAAKQEFHADPTLRARLRALVTNTNPEVRLRAAAWQRFIDRDRLTADPEVARLTQQILAAADGATGQPKAGEVLGTFILDPDAAKRAAALAVIERRTANVLPLMAARGKRMDELARSLGAADAITFSEGPDARTRLDATCRDLQARSEPAWKLLLARAERLAKRPPTLADYGAAGIAWINDAGNFFKPEDLRRLAETGFAEMGFDVPAMKIQVVNNPNTPGGSAFAISIPDDVRFQGNFTTPGYYAGRGYFHELGHAVHMKLVRAPHLPDRMLPQDRALNEAIGEIFTLIPTDEAWLARQFPALTPTQRQDFFASVRGFDALGIRYNCLLAKLELDVHAGKSAAERWPVLYRETFGAAPPLGPAFLLLNPGYLKSPFYMRSYVYLIDVRESFIRKLGDTPLVTTDAGAFLEATLLAPGNALTLEAYLADPRDLRAWKAARR